MKKIFVLTTGLLFYFFAASAQLSSVYTARLQFVLDSVCSRLNIKGVSAAVLVPNTGTWKGVYGVSAQGVPVTPDMLFGIGSNTKTYVSTLMLLLQEKGMVSINDTIGKWITNNPNISGQITIQQLLNHTSGIYSYTDNTLFNDSLVTDFTRTWQPEDIVQFIDTPYFKAGTSWHYSNSNYLIAGLIIKQILAQPINITMRNYILAPQRLNHTVFCPQDATTDAIADSWTLNFGYSYLVDMQAQPGYSNNALFSMAATAGGMMTTAEENVIFWHNLISGQIINTASLNKMMNWVYIGYSSPVSGHAIDYGLGIFRYEHYMNGHTIYCHGGTNVGFINENMVDSITGVTISVLTNQDSIDNYTVANTIIKALHKVTLTTQPTLIASVKEPGYEINVYPNPVSNYINLQLNHVSLPVRVTIHDATGRTVISKEINADHETINTTALASGTYLLQVTTTGSAVLAVQKVEVVH